MSPHYTVHILAIHSSGFSWYSGVPLAYSSCCDVSITNPSFLFSGTFFIFHTIMVELKYFINRDVSAFKLLKSYAMCRFFGDICHEI